MKNQFNYLTISTLASLIISSPAWAVLPGPYGGIGLGMATIQLPSSNFFNAGSIDGNEWRDTGGLDGKLLLGYNFNHYIGLEASFCDYARSMYQAQAPGNLNAQLRYTMSSLNIAGKGYLPLGNKTPLKIDAYLLLGLAEAFSNANYQNNGIPLANNADATLFDPGGTDTSELRPFFGAGVSYRIPKTAVLVEIEYTHVDGVGNIKTDSRAILNADLFTLNVLYSFRQTIPDEADIT